jgi:3-methylcrotonyl-CoA carboxylase alpha subunit
MGDAAVAAAKAIGYTGAGTIEFIAETDEARAGALGGKFYFMEMNTRLQVEHPVTEMITGLDLVELQLRVAAGEALPFAQKDLSFRGHAIEARIYAEDPAREFLPSTGRLVHLAFPPESDEVRVDAGVAPGGEITPWYDPMIAKLIVHGADRTAALERLRAALDAVEIAGPATNVAFLRRVAASRAFSAAELDTGLIERNRAELLAKEKTPAGLLAAAALAELAEEEAQARARAARSGEPHSPWHRVDGWRLNAESHHDFVFVEGEIGSAAQGSARHGAQHAVRLRFLDTGLRLVLEGAEHDLQGERHADGVIALRLDGRALKARAVRSGRDWHVFCDGVYRRLALKDELASVADETDHGALTAPMPGKIVKLMTRPDAKVKKGDPLLILEAMKMEHTIAAPADGTVKEIRYALGEQVLEGAELITLE